MNANSRKRFCKRRSEIIVFLRIASATNVSVLLELQAGILSLIVEDNGKGFELTEAAVMTGNDRGLGLLGMKERAELFGGKIEIESSPGKGTSVYVRVPAVFDVAEM